MNKNVLCAILALAWTTNCLSTYADKSYVGHWALTSPTGTAGWLGVEEADFYGKTRDCAIQCK